MTTTPTRIRVLLVDDESHILDAICMMIDTQPDMDVMGRLNCADYLVDAAWESGPDVIMLDLSMPGADPTEAMRRLLAMRPQAKVLVCSAFDTPAIVERMIDAGAWGFVSKHTEPAFVLDAIRRVAAGHSVVPQAA